MGSFFEETSIPNSTDPAFHLVYTSLPLKNIHSDVIIVHFILVTPRRVLHYQTVEYVNNVVVGWPFTRTYSKSIE